MTDEDQNPGLSKTIEKFAPTTDITDREEESRMMRIKMHVSGLQFKD